MNRMEELQIVTLDMGELKFFVKRVFDTKDPLYVGTFFEVYYQLYVSGISSRINYPVRIITPVVKHWYPCDDVEKIINKYKEEIIGWLRKQGYQVEGDDT